MIFTIVGFTNFYYSYFRVKKKLGYYMSDIMSDTKKADKLNNLTKSAYRWMSILTIIGIGLWVALTLAFEKFGIM